MVDEAFLESLGFGRIASSRGRELTVGTKLQNEPAVYVAVLDDEVFWVGETGRLRARFSDYQRWFALTDDSTRRDKKTRDELLRMTGGKELVFYAKPPDLYLSPLTGKQYSAHRVEETALIDHFRPAWNLRKGGRGEGVRKS